MDPIIFHKPSHEPDQGRRHTPGDDGSLTELMAVYDEAVAHGLTPQPQQTPSEADAADRLARGMACLRLLEQAWPRARQPHDEADLSPRDVPGQFPRRIGRFEIRRELGHGGCGVVFLAWDPTLHREVALKVPRPGALITPDLRNRFLREAWALAGLDHPNVVTVYEAGEVGLVCYIASAYCSGPTLAAWLKERPAPCPALLAAQILSQVTDAVAHAHERGVLHRDLKPSNILLQDETPKITDFGLAKLLEADIQETNSGVLLGTASYMAPEQARGARDIGPAADVYALGAILYEILTGRPPFVGETELDTLLQVQSDEPAPPRRLRPKVPRDLETICLACLQKQPAKRYVSAQALGEDLRRFLTGEPIRARAMGPVGRLGCWCGRNPALAWASGVACACFLGVTVLAVIFALYQYRANDRLVHSAQRLRRAGEQTKAALKKAEQNYVFAERSSARLALDQGLSCCEQGKIERGILWLARSLEIASRLDRSEAADIQWLSRANLAGWYRELSPLCGLFEHPPRGIRAAIFSPDDQKILTVGCEDSVRLWEAATGEQLGLHIEPNTLAAVFSPDGRTVVTANKDGMVGSWDVRTGKCLAELGGHEGPVWAVAYSRDGQTVVTGGEDQTARVWRVSGPTQPGVVLPHDGPVISVACNPNGQIVLTCCGSRAAHFWDTTTGKTIGKPLLHEAAVWAVAYSPDGKMVLTGSDDHTARLWEATSGEPCGVFHHTDDVRSVAFSLDGRTIVTGCSDRTARLWDVSTGKQLGRPLSQSGGVPCVAFGADGQTVLTGGWMQPGRLRKVIRDPPLLLNLEHPDEVRAVAYSPDGGAVLTGCKDNIVRFWDAAKGERLRPTLQHQGRILAIALSRDGRTVLTGSHDRTARQWVAATGKPIGQPLAHPGQVNAVAFSRDGRTLLTGCEDGAARFWDAASGQPGRLPPLRHQTAIQAVAYSPDGRMVLTSDGDDSVCFWEATTGRLLGEPLRLQVGTFDVAFSEDGRTILTGCRDMTARLWDVATRERVGAPMLHQASVKAVAFSPRNRMIATGSYDKTVRLWDAATRGPIGPPIEHQGEVSSVAFSPDGRMLLTGSWDRTARLWPVPRPVEGEVERIVLWVQVITGMELDLDGAALELTQQAWQDRRARLQQLGGPPLP